MPEPLKNMINKEIVGNLADEILSVQKDFNKKKFIKLVFDNEWESRELKQRIRQISICLNEIIGKPYPDTIKIFKSIYGRFSGLSSFIFCDYIEVYGIDYYKESVEAMELFTTKSSAEFAIRPFIIKYPDKAMQLMLKWSKHKNEHVRRLSSEGCRPRLPWTIALPEFKKDPSPILPILENLKNDPSEYVRKSVANNLNDISKDHPEIVIDMAKKWKGNNPNTDWIVKHACRTLLKKGDREALKLFGTANNVKYEIKDLRLKKKRIKLNEENEISCTLTLKEKKETNLRLEYVVYYVKAKGQLTKKIFKISEKKVKPNEDLKILKKHKFIDQTTRTHYPGVHKMSLVINGNETEAFEFELVR
ncbi:MAG: DNA alkylation repair protein [Ignavibacteria bacterium]|jgi:3-methyladenine DNA glycosylase AlkC